MAAPAFLVEAPRIVPRKGIVFIEVNGNDVCCMAISTFTETVESALAVVVELQHAQSAQIAKLSERGPLFLREHRER